jgi:hypothetical protein
LSDPATVNNNEQLPSVQKTTPTISDPSSRRCHQEVCEEGGVSFIVSCIAKRLKEDGYKGTVVEKRERVHRG